MAIQLPGAASRRERRARFWDILAENSANLVAVYGRMLDGSVGPVVGEHRARLERRRAECVSAEANAKQHAMRIRSGLE